MRATLVLFVCGLIFFGFGACSNPLGKLVEQYFQIKSAGGNGGGTDCVGCVIVVALVDQNAQINNKSIDKVVAETCQIFPKEVKLFCDNLVEQYGPTVIKLLDEKYTADEVCFSIDFCTNQTCHLFPKRAKSFNIPRVQVYIPPHVDMGIVWPWEEVANHLPALDEDRDKFGTTSTLRGTHWRGKDCGPLRSDIYPGRFDKNYDVSEDHNCNGIYGIDKNTSAPYEKLYCSSTKQYGYVVLGDSAAAHFHAPPQWVTAYDINKEAFSDMLPILEDEFDWPEESAGTGYVNMKWNGHPEGPLDSFYLRMRQRNLCMHRDYQNIGVNGARAGAMNDIVETMARNPQTDFPVFAVHALVGNDVCNGHFGTDHMTTPQQFQISVLKTLNYLDTVLPAGSHVVFMGLVDGRILYDAMHDRIYPLGAVNKDVTYSALYDYLNCLEISPCFGWMNSDAHWRNATTERANQLNAVYPQIIANNKFKNFDMTYFDSPLNEVVDMWVKQGGHAWDLIEPVDGFHPNQLANALLSQVLWDKITANYTYLLNPINPYNQQITKIFGDQGGY